MIEKVVGYQALCEMYNLGVMPHYRKSYISTSGRSHERHDSISEIHVYPILMLSRISRIHFAT